jgi:LEA14-like dessication related protein
MGLMKIRSNRFLPVFLSLFGALMLSSCASMNPDYEQPTVSISSFKVAPVEGGLPTFDIGLRIINPNPDPLNIQGVVYSISLQGQELIKGVGKDYPQIEGYSQSDISLSASANVLNGVRFIANMMEHPEDRLGYEFKAKLDLGGFWSSLRVSESGSFNLGGDTNRNQP